MPRAPVGRRGRLRVWKAARGHAPAGPPRARSLLRRRPDRGRGVRVPVVPGEQDVCQRRHLLRLPQPARHEGRGVRGPGLRRLPRGREVRDAQAPLPQGRLDGSQLCRLPHADAQLHGGPRPARPQHPDPEAGPVGLHRDSQRLHELPQESLERVGVCRGAQVVGREAAKRAALRGDDPGRPGSLARRRRGARRSSPGTRRSLRSCGEPLFLFSAGRTERPRRTCSRRRLATRIPSCAAAPSPLRRRCLRRRGWLCFCRSSPIPC